MQLSLAGQSQHGLDLATPGSRRLCYFKRNHSQLFHRSPFLPLPPTFLQRAERTILRGLLAADYIALELAGVPLELELPVALGQVAL